MLKLIEHLEVILGFLNGRDAFAVLPIGSFKKIHHKEATTCLDFTDGYGTSETCVQGSNYHHFCNPNP